MSNPWRRPSALPTDSELSLSQTDEILFKTSSRRTSTDVVEVTPVRRETRRTVLTEKQKKWTIWTIYLIGFIDLLGVSMMIPLLPKFTRNLGASRALAGLIGSLYGTLQVFSSPVMGRFSDMYGRKTILLLSYLGPCLGYIGLGLAGSLTMLVLSRIPNGILKHGLSVSKAYLTDVTEKSERQSVLGLFNACSSFGFIFGPLISGYMADLDPTLQTSILLGALIFGLDFFLVLILLPSLSGGDNVGTQGGNTGKLSDALQSINLKRFVASVNIFKGIHWRDIYDLISIRFLLTFSVIIFRSNFSVFLEEHFRIDNTTLGQILSFNGVASAISAATSGRVSKFYTSHARQLIHFTLLLAGSFACLTIAPGFQFVILLLVPLTLATSNLRICMLSLMLQRGREDERGAIIGLANSMSSVSRMLAPSIVGFAQEYSVELAGYFSTLLACAAVVCLVVFPIEKNSGVHKKSQ